MDKSDLYDNNFKVNLALANISEEYLEEFTHRNHIDWKYISPKIQTVINNLTFALDRAVKMSNEECKMLEGK